MLNGLHITLPRLKLIEVLTERRDALQQEYVEMKDEVTLAINSLASVPVSLNSWYATIAEGLAEGSFVVRADGTLMASSGANGEEPPARPSTSTKNTTKKSLRNTLTRIEGDAQGSAAVFDSALLLLGHATDVDVTVAVGEYERVLSQRPYRHHY
jgi:hypothetical protein